MRMAGPGASTDSLWQGVLSTPLSLIERSNSVISLQNITKVYDGSDVPALDGVSIDIPDGDIFGIIGISGAGK